MQYQSIHRQANSIPMWIFCPHVSAFLSLDLKQGHGHHIIKEAGTSIYCKEFAECWQLRCLGCFQTSDDSCAHQARSQICLGNSEMPAAIPILKTSYSSRIPCAEIFFCIWWRKLFNASELLQIPSARLRRWQWLLLLHPYVKPAQYRGLRSPIPLKYRCSAQTRGDFAPAELRK